MEKRTPHYDLEKLKELLQSSDTRRITGRSQRQAAELGFNTPESMVEVVETLANRCHFDKSMTKNSDHTVWQDVYKKEVTIDEEQVLLYIKLQESPVGTGVIISFHRSDDW